MVINKGKGRLRKNKGEVIMVEDNQIVEEEQSIDIPADTDVMGTDVNLLYAGRDEHTLELFHAGQKWVFKYKDLSWGQKNECIDQAQQWDQQDGFKFSINKYYAVALTKMLTDSPIKPVTETTLNRLDRLVGEQLIAIVPLPVEQNLDDIKKA